MITKIRRVERITRYNNSTWEEATLCLLNPGKLARFSNFADVSSFFFSFFFLFLFFWGEGQGAYPAHPIVEGRGVCSRRPRTG